MARNEKTALKCVLFTPSEPDSDRVHRVVASATKEVGIHLVIPPESASLLMFSETLFREIASADLVLALLSQSSTNVFYELGLAHAVGKPVIILAERGNGATMIGPRLEYNRSDEGLHKLHANLKGVLEDFIRNPRQFRISEGLGVRQTALPMVDLDKLEPREFENLCFELLTQMGFKRVEWGKELKEIDVVATLPKKDPDGFEYHELWLISMGLHTPPELFLDMAADLDYFAHRLLRPGVLEHLPSSFKRDTPLTLLLILHRTEHPVELLEQELRRAEHGFAKRSFPFTLRFRTWDRQHITNLIQQFPQLAYKYFSEEGRAQSTSRKTTEEFYRETVALNERLQAMNTALKEEREKRVRAERDAIWKDVAFKAAHKLGNPIFALETDLQGLKRRIKDDPDDAARVALEMGTSIEKAKGIIEQFKSLTRAQEISKREVDLQPLIQAASRIASENGVEVTLQVNGNSTVMADPTRMTECFDELFANALHWFNKPKKHISVLIDNPKRKDIPPDLDESRKYVRIRFEDNGCGVPPKMKKKIFAPFYTTHTHGTGLGLSMVERIIQGHEGMIRENGNPGESAVFEIFLPQKTEKA